MHCILQHTFYCNYVGQFGSSVVFDTITAGGIWNSLGMNVVHILNWTWIHVMINLSLAEYLLNLNFIGYFTFNYYIL